MPSAATDLLRLEKQAAGENSEVWGDRANTVFELIEDAVSKFHSLVLAADANYTLVATNFIADEARNMGLNITSSLSLTLTRDIIVPTSTKSYLVKNATTGAQSLRVKTSAGTGITVPNGKTTFLLCDGTNVVSAVDWLNALSLGTPLAITDGGTASTTASAARTALGLAIGTNVEAWDADLDALAALAGTGIIVRTGAATYAQRTLTGTANQITVTNGDGVAGDPTISLPSAVTISGAMTAGSFVGGTGSFTTLSASGAATVAGLTSTGIVNVNAAGIDSNQTSFGAFGTPTTLTIGGGASAALNIGHASAAAAFAGGISIPTGKNVTGTGTAQVTGFATISGTTLTGTLSTAAQPNVTSLGTLTSVVTSGTVTGNAAMLSPITNSLGADVLLNNTANYFDGPSVAQGASGTWFVSGTVTLENPTNTSRVELKLWDGTTVIDSAVITINSGTNVPLAFTLSGFITSPAGNLRISAKNPTSTAGKISFNNSGLSKDSTITAIRIG